LFVQGAKMPTFDKSSNKVTLEGISLATVFSSDHPSALPSRSGAGAKDSFQSNSPDADISILGSQLRQVIAVLQDPDLKGDNLTYTVKIPAGDMPPKGRGRGGVYRLICGPGRRCRSASCGAVRQMDDRRRR
jgi:hypothetical protein